MYASILIHMNHSRGSMYISLTIELASICKNERETMKHLHTASCNDNRPYSTSFVHHSLTTIGTQETIHQNSLEILKGI